MKLTTNFYLQQKLTSYCVSLRNIPLHFNFLLIECVAGIELAAGWTGRRSNPGGGEIFRAVQIGPEPPSSPVERVSGIFRG
jgi:hypothetical protein